MSTSAIIAVVVAVVVVLAAVVVFAVAGRLQIRRATGQVTRETRGRDLQARRQEARAAADASGGLVPVGGTELEAWTPPDERAVGIARRQFLTRGIWTLAALGGLGFAVSALSYLWPSSSGGFGGKISVGRLTDIMLQIQKGDGAYYVPEGKLWLAPYPPSSLQKAQKVYSAPELAPMQDGLVVLYQKCPHLGCRVPWCASSQWFECPCHGSKYNHVGEWKAGPAPRGMDRFAAEVSGGSLTVNTGQVILGPPHGTDTTGQEAEGPHCVSI